MHYGLWHVTNVQAWFIKLLWGATYGSCVMQGPAIIPLGSDSEVVSEIDVEKQHQSWSHMAYAMVMHFTKVLSLNGVTAGRGRLNEKKSTLRHKTERSYWLLAIRAAWSAGHWILHRGCHPTTDSIAVTAAWAAALVCANIRQSIGAMLLCSGTPVIFL